MRAAFAGGELLAGRHAAPAPQDDPVNVAEAEARHAHGDDQVDDPDRQIGLRRGRIDAPHEPEIERAAIGEVGGQRDRGDDRDAFRHGADLRRHQHQGDVDTHVLAVARRADARQQHRPNGQHDEDALRPRVSGVEGVAQHDLYRADDEGGERQHDDG